MEKFLEAATIAWNPIGEARRRWYSGELTFGTVLVPFIGIVIACNLFAGTAQAFFMETLAYQIGAEVPEHPLLNNDFALRFMSAIGVLAPVGLVAALPASVFDPPGRSATVATMLIVAAASSFYGAAVGSLVYFVSGALITTDLEFGFQVFEWMSILAIIGLIALVIWFWLRICRSILELGSGQIVGISLVAIVASALLVAFATYVASG